MSAGFKTEYPVLEATRVSSVRLILSVPFYFKFTPPLWLHFHVQFLISHPQHFICACVFHIKICLIPYLFTV
jgi:hypothetical protein